MTIMTRATTTRFGCAAALLALIAGPALTGEAFAQEIMLERIGAVRMAQPGGVERDGDWLLKAYRNQARLGGYDLSSLRVSSSRPDDAAFQAR